MNNLESKIPSISVRIDRITTDEARVKAFASATIANAFAVHGIRIYKSEEKGYFIAMPLTTYHREGGNQYQDTFHPVTAEARTALIDEVIAAYEKAIAGPGEH